MSNVKLIGSVNLAKLKNVADHGESLERAVRKRNALLSLLRIMIFSLRYQQRPVLTDSSTNLEIFGLGVEVYEKMNVDQYGNSHYLKCAVSKDDVNSHSPEEGEAKNKTFISAT